MRRIGIDVGGTNTDAVLLDGRARRACGQDPDDCGRDRRDRRPRSSRLTPATLRSPAAQIDGVVIGTTHFVNAVVQRRDLSRVAAVRIGLPASASLPPFCDWPADLAELVRGEVFMLEGGHDYDGRPIVPFDEAGMRQAARRDPRQAASARSPSPRSSRRSTRACEELARDDPRRGMPRRGGDALARARPHRAAGTRERRAAQCRARRAGA